MSRRPKMLSRGSWTPVRAEIERILDDQEWHAVPGLLARLNPYVDPRVAARAWFRTGPRGGLPRDTGNADELFVSNERKALIWGRRRVVSDMIIELIGVRRLEVRGHLKYKRAAWDHAEVRLNPEAAARDQEHAMFCARGHPKPQGGWPQGRKGHCHECQRYRRAQARAVA